MYIDSKGHKLKLRSNRNYLTNHTAECIITNADVDLLVCNGGGIFLTKHWAKNLLHRMDMVK